MWTDWRTTSSDYPGNEETLELNVDEEITKINGYSYGDTSGYTCSLQAETSAGRSWGPHGERSPYDDGRSLRSAPTAGNGLRLNHISGDQTKDKIILRWLLQYYPMKTSMIVGIVYIDD